MDRDAAARAAVHARVLIARSRPARRVRRGRGAAHRDQRQVHARRGWRPTSPRPGCGSSVGTPIRDELFALSLAPLAATGQWLRDMQINDSGALVAGGASGLGEATVRRLHAARRARGDRRPQRGARAARSPRELGERAQFVRADVTDADTVAGCGRRRRRTARRPADLGLLRRDRLGREGRRQARSARARAVRDGDRRQPDRHLQRAAAGGRRDARRRAHGRQASAACASTPPRSPRSTGRSARSPTRPPRAAIVGMTLAGGARSRAATGSASARSPRASSTRRCSARYPTRPASRSAARSRSRRGSAVPTEFAALAAHIVENEMLNGEVIRLDGALRMPPK